MCTGESESAKSRPSGPRSWATIAAAAPVQSAVVAPATQPTPTPAAASTTTPNEKAQKPQAAPPKNKQPTVEAQTQAGRQSPTPGDPTIGEVEVTETEEVQAGESSPIAGDALRSPYGEYRGRVGRGPPPPAGDELYVTMLPPDWNEEKVFNFFTCMLT